MPRVERSVRPEHPTSHSEQTDWRKDLGARPEWEIRNVYHHMRNVTQDSAETSRLVSVLPGTVRWFLGPDRCGSTSVSICSLGPPTAGRWSPVQNAPLPGPWGPEQSHRSGRGCPQLTESAGQTVAAGSQTPAA